MKKNNINSNTQGEHYKIRSSVKPENVVLASNYNTILKISKEINFLYNIIQYAVKSQERLFFLIVTEDPLLDIETLKQYLMEKELTEFAKKEIIKISEIINNAILLQSEYEKIPRAKKFTEYNFTEKKGDGARGAVNGSLLYIIITKNRIIQADENSFRKECNNLPYFYMLETHKILNTFNELINLLKPNQSSLNNETVQNSKTNHKEGVVSAPHNHIFKGNAFEIWELLFENFNIDETKRTDLRFMYEIMKHNGQIHDTVTVKNITDWINDTYQFSIVKLQYTNIHSKSNENRMSIYNLIKSRV